MTAPTVTSLLVGSSELEVEIVLAETNVDLTVVDSTMGLQVGSAAVVTAVLVGGPAGATGPAGSGIIIRTDVVPATTNSSYTLSQVAANVGSVQVSRNGLIEAPGVGFTVVNSGGSTVVTLTTAPLLSDVLVVTYDVEG
jgi:hypothetical protein